MASVSVCLSILDADFVAEIEYRITSRGAPETGPTYSCGGQPAEPPEWDIEDVQLREYHPRPLLAANPLLDVPKWLFELISEHDKVSEAIYEAIWKDERADYD